MCGRWKETTPVTFRKSNRALENIAKLSLERGDPVTFPNIGVSKYMAYGPSALLMRVNEIVSKDFDDPSFNVDDMSLLSS